MRLTIEDLHSFLNAEESKHVARIGDLESSGYAGRHCGFPVPGAPSGFGIVQRPGGGRSEQRLGMFKWLLVCVPVAAVLVPLAHWTLKTSKVKPRFYQFLPGFNKTAAEVRISAHRISLGKENSCRRSDSPRVNV
jgi:hypothetical protein